MRKNPPFVLLGWTAPCRLRYLETMSNRTPTMSRYCRPTSRNRGFTLVELMVTVAVLAIVLGLGVPLFQDFVSRNRLVATTNELVSAMALARSEAVKRAARVTVASADWTDGWQVFVDTGTVGDASGDTVLRVHQPNANGAPDDYGGRQFFRLHQLPSFGRQRGQRWCRQWRFRSLQGWHCPGDFH